MNMTITKFQIMTTTMMTIMMMRNMTTKKTMMMMKMTMTMTTKMIVADHEAGEAISSVTIKEDLHLVADVLEDHKALEAAHVLEHGAAIPVQEAEHPKEDLHL
jgi:hypothetical protein